VSVKFQKKYNFKIYEILKDTIFEIIKISKRHERSEWNEVSVKIKNLPVIFYGG